MKLRLSRYHWTVDLAYYAEKQAARIWHHFAQRTGGVTAGRFLDEAVTWPQQLRYRAERKHPLR